MGWLAEFLSPPLIQILPIFQHRAYNSLGVVHLSTNWGDRHTHPLQSPTVPFFTEVENHVSSSDSEAGITALLLLMGNETREGLVSGRAGGLTLKLILSPPWYAVPPPLRSSWVRERGLRVLTSPGMPFPLGWPAGDQEPSFEDTDLYFKGQFLYDCF